MFISFVEVYNNKNRKDYELFDREFIKKETSFYEEGEDIFVVSDKELAHLRAKKQALLERRIKNILKMQNRVKDPAFSATDIQ